MGNLSLEGEGAEGVGVLGRTAIVPDKQLGHLSLAGTWAAGEAIPIVSVSSVGDSLRAGGRPLIVSGLESFLRAQGECRIGNDPLEEIKAKQGSNDSARGFVRNRL